ncbi:MAG TPA: RHS repeat-associated core domain-containing protein [Sedimentisphaerales bacterium]|nr:RHS repeat-associated core domain-containing protein [Sedimentisphaerales bacterium]
MNEVGTVYERYEYDAYGEPTIWDGYFTTTRQASNYGNSYLFTGRRVDILDNASLKIQYNRNRYYDYYTGRWLTHDPLGINPAGGGQNPFALLQRYGVSLNVYEYAHLNPVTYVDPSGAAGCPAGSCGGKVNCGVTWHRLPPSLVSVFPIVVNIGHDWIEYPGGSMGFWPTGSIWGSDGWVARADPHEGDWSGTNYGTVKSDSCWRDLKYGSGKGNKCRCATCEEIYDCLEHIAIKWDADMRFDPASQNCRHFAAAALTKCCLNKCCAF